LLLIITSTADELSDDLERPSSLKWRVLLDFFAILKVNCAKITGDKQRQPVCEKYLKRGVVLVYM